MPTTFEDHGFTVAGVQATFSIILHPTILLVFCHGIHTCVFSVALYYIAQSTQPRQKRITLASIVTFLWAANTIIVASQWKYVDDLFISHGVSLEDEFSFYFYDSDRPEVLTTDVFRILSTILADLILIWRCWVLYSGSLVVVAIPSLCLVTEIISAGIAVTVSIDPILLDGNQVNWTLVYYSMTLVTNSLCTFLILFRIVRVSGVSASLKTYRGIIEILVESAAVYAIIYAALLGRYAYEFYSQQTTENVSSYIKLISYSITGIAPTLIIVRVMAGHSRPDDSWTRPSLPHLRTPMRSIVESLRFASAPVTERTTADNDVELALEPDIGEAEAYESASNDKCAEDKSFEVKV